jgi:hypothetical protein
MFAAVHANSIAAGELQEVAMSDKNEAEDVRAHLLALFEGAVGRRPSTDQELDEWLASPQGRTATMFEPTSLSRWGEAGRS